MKKYNIQVIYNTGGSAVLPGFEANNFLRAAITGRNWAKQKPQAKLLVVTEYGGKGYSQTYIL